MTRPTEIRGARVCLVLLIAVLAACGRSDVPPITPLTDVLEGRVNDGAAVTVEGTVVSLTPLPAAAAISYRLSDGAISIVVVSPETSELPQVADRVRISGVVRTEYTVEAPGEAPVPFGTVIEEVGRQSVVDADVSARDLWTWAGGVAGVVVLGWLVAWAIIRRASTPQEDEISPCRGCQGEVQSSWISCPWCGLKRDAKAPSPATMIVEPMGGDVPAAEGRSGVAGATIIIAPEDDE